MKKLLLTGIMFALLLCVGANAQSYTLQFSQAILVSSTQQTVPTGKVWKVEGVASPRMEFGYNQAISDQNILINGVTISVQLNGIYNTGYSSGSPQNLGWGTHFPLWLPAGTTLKTGSNVAYISVIEFNLSTP
ncbi:MAG: hypothetical protein WCM76_13340 [Bacteroidota bacterium]